ncbi:hypothetical protein CGRA01v4_07938 [Colletotrichum graminicola]|nr:hypothetical protein CGRA01v4_07938 [Colletotrichum graminicola]
MARWSRRGWILVIVVVLLTLVSPTEGHHKKKSKQPEETPAPAPVPPVVPVPPPAAPPAPAPQPAPPAPPPPAPPPPAPPPPAPPAPPAPPPPPPAPPPPPPAPPPSPPAPIPKPEFTEEEINDGRALAKLNRRALENAHKTNDPQTHLGDNNYCQGAFIPVRKEWRTLSVPQRKEFIAAVQCMMKQPALSDPKRVPMAKSLYDDFVAVHYNSFKNIQFTVSLFVLYFRSKRENCVGLGADKHSRLPSLPGTGTTSLALNRGCVRNADIKVTIDSNTIANRLQLTTQQVLCHTGSGALTSTIRLFRQFSTDLRRHWEAMASSFPTMAFNCARPSRTT